MNIMNIHDSFLYSFVFNIACVYAGIQLHACFMEKVEPQDFFLL